MSSCHRGGVACRTSAARDRPPVQPPRLVRAPWTPTAANALGIARGAIDSLAEIAATEASTMSANLLRDRPLVQTRIAEADAIVNAARAFVFDAVGRLWRTLCAGETPSDQQIARGRLALVHAMHESSARSTRCFMPPVPTRSTRACRSNELSVTFTSRCSMLRIAGLFRIGRESNFLGYGQATRAGDSAPPVRDCSPERREERSAT